MSETDARAARLALERLIDGRELDLPPGFADAVERYVALLLDANRRLNVTRIVEPTAIARLHLLDALAALPIADRAAPAAAVDLGSGGGVPGLVLALARPGVAWTLVDSVRKKADALRGFADALGLRNINVSAERAESLGRDAAHRARYDLVTARACAALPVLTEYALPLLRDGGQLVAWKGRIGEVELSAGSAAAAILGGGPPSVEPSGWEALGDHRFVVVTKLSDTPDAYPRTPGTPTRRPISGNRAS